MFPSIKYTSNIKDIDYKWLVELKIGDGEPHTIEWYKKLLENSTFWIAALDGDKMVGFARTFGDGMIWLMVIGLNVRSDYRQHGIARELMRRIVKFAKDNGYQTVRLFAALDEDPGLKDFYEKIGFERMDNGYRSKNMPW
jgi:ribosomal protein S18 acetylase RimI-like enzyme